MTEVELIPKDSRCAGQPPARGPGGWPVLRSFSSGRKDSDCLDVYCWSEAAVKKDSVTSGVHCLTALWAGMWRVRR